MSDVKILSWLLCLSVVVVVVGAFIAMPNKTERAALSKTYTTQVTTWADTIHLVILGADCDHEGACTLVLESGTPVSVECNTERCRLKQP